MIYLWSPLPLYFKQELHTSFVSIERTLAPGQRILEGVEEIPHDPGHNGVVVQTHQRGH